MIRPVECRRQRTFGILGQIATKLMLDKLQTVIYSDFVDILRMIDDIDKQILTIVQDNARISNAEIARTVGLAPSAVLERIRKLEERGIIRGYHADIAPKPLDLGLTAFVAVRTTDWVCEDLFADVPEIIEVHDLAGEDDYLLKIRAKDTEDLGRIIRENIKSVPTVRGTRTTIVIETVKERMMPPIDRPQPKKTGRGEKAKKK